MPQRQRSTKKKRRGGRRPVEGMRPVRRELGSRSGSRQRRRRWIWQLRSLGWWLPPWLKKYGGSKLHAGVISRHASYNIGE